MDEQAKIELKSAIQIHQAMTEYRDAQYLNMIQQINTKAKNVLKDDVGSKFVENCGRDFAGEIVRNYFNTSDYNITVDQMAMRILKFKYDDEYDPIAHNSELQKSVYNYNDLNSATLDSIISEIDDNQVKLFEKTNGKYNDSNLIEKNKREYAASHTDENGVIVDEYTGKDGEYVIDKNGNKRRRQEVDHVQATATATYNKKYLSQKGVDELKSMMNSSDNFAMMDKIANESKGDVRVYDKDGKDITHRASPEQIAEATCERWENVSKDATKKELIAKGYLNEEGKVPKAVRKKLEQNIRHSQNVESVVILKNTKYDVVAKDAACETGKSIGKIIAGQIIYYAAPPLVYEVRNAISDKSEKLDGVLTRITEAGKRIANYVFFHLKDIFKNVVENTLKKFIKTFLDILINLVKATVKKMLKLAKNLVLSCVDAVKIIADKNSTATEKADSVVNLFAVTITTFVIEALFEVIEKGLHIPEWLLTPLQLMATIVCTNLTMLVLQKADLFDVRFGFKVNAVKKVFEEERAIYAQNMELAERYTQTKVKEIIKMAQVESRQIYNDLQELDPKRQSVRGQLEGINRMFSMNIDFVAEWLRFIGLDAIAAFTN